MLTAEEERELLAKVRATHDMERVDVDSSRRAESATNALPFMMVAQEAAMVVRIMALPLTAAIDLVARGMGYTVGFYLRLLRRFLGRGRKDGDQPAAQAQAPGPAPARPPDAGVENEAPSPGGPAVQAPGAFAAKAVRRGFTIGRALSGLGSGVAAVALTGGGLVVLAGMPFLLPWIAGLGIGGGVLMGAGVVVTGRAARRAQMAAQAAPAAPARPRETSVDIHAVGPDVAPAPPSPRVPPVVLQPATGEMAHDTGELDPVG